MSDNARQRYRSDPVFHRLVDNFRAILRDSHATPSELREALMLAVYCEELENPSPVFARISLLGQQLAADVIADRPHVVFGAVPPCGLCDAWKRSGGEPCPIHPGMWCAKHRTAGHAEGSVACESL